MKSRHPIDPLSASLFRKAAQHIEEERDKFTCCALNNVSRGSRIKFKSDSPACLWFEKMFKPTDSSNFSPWYSTYESDDYLFENQTARILGLTVAAILLEEGGWDT